MDLGYEFDAPKFYDFKRTDDGVSMASRWFDAQEEDLAGELGNVTKLELVEGG